MYAVEFRAKIKDGLIEIPDQYRKHLTHQVRVIVLTEENLEAASTYIDQLLMTPTLIDDFRPLTRDEVYAG